jgi:hypothetical protein
MTEKVLVTGVSGWIAKHTTIKLLFLTVPKTSYPLFNNSIVVCFAIHPLTPVTNTFSVILDLSYGKDVSQLQAQPCIPFQPQ